MFGCSNENRGKRMVGIDPKVLSNIWVENEYHSDTKMHFKN